MKLTVKQINLIVDSLKDEIDDDTNKDNEKDLEELIELLENLPVPLNERVVTLSTEVPNNICLTSNK